MRAIIEGTPYDRPPDLSYLWSISATFACELCPRVCTGLYTGSLCNPPCLLRPVRALWRAPSWHSRTLGHIRSNLGRLEGPREKYRF